LVMGAAILLQMARVTAVHVSQRRSGAHVVAQGVERWADFTRLTVVLVFRSVVFFGLNTFVPLYWTHVLHGSKSGAAYALTAMLSAVAIGTLVGGRLADNYGRRIVIVVSLIAVVPLILLFLWSSDLLLAGVMLIPVGGVLAASNSVVVVMAQEYLPNRVGLAAGVTMGLSMTLGGLLMPLFGSIADHYGLPTALTILACLPAIGFALSLGLHESSGGTANEMLSEEPSAAASS
jgi:FSR family fosmidomycin resistance protein-like MFS transporter